jgi:hypothetical protein
MLVLRQSTAIDIRIGPFVDAGDGVTPETGVTLSGADQAEVLKKDGAATATMTGTFAAVTGADGWYDYTASTTDTNTVGEVVFIVQDSTLCLPSFTRAMVVEEAVYDAMFASGAAGYAAVSDLGTVQTGDTYALAYGAQGFSAINTDVETILSRIIGTLAAGTHNPASTAQLAVLTDWINGGRLDLLLDAIPTTAMRGTDNAALASLVTSARMNVLTDWINGGRLDILLDAIPTTAMRGTDSGPTNTQMVAAFTEIKGASFSTSTDSLEAIRDRGDSAWITGGGGGSGGATPAEVATALTDIHLDKLFANSYDPSSKPGSATALLNELVENDGGVARYTVNALENGPSGSGSSAEVIAAAVFNTLQSEHKLAGTYGLYLQSNSGYVPASGHASGLTSETAPFNAYEYGQVIRANMKQDVSAFTVFEIVIQPEQGSSKNASQLPNRPKGAIIASGSDVTVGTVDVTIGDVLYAANEYLEYTTKQNDLSHPGTWRVRGTVVKSAANKLLGDFLRFTVLD